MQRNRAEVNALFKEEHDRIAQELVGTKLVWAEAQETIVKLKRSLVKSQEKSSEWGVRAGHRGGVRAQLGKAG